MSDGQGMPEIIVSQLGSPRDHAAEWVGAIVLLFALLAYLGLEHGFGRLMARCWRAVWRKETGRRDEL